MKKGEILAIFKSLSRSQGFYSRIYNSLMELSEEERNKRLQPLEDKNFKDTIDLILYLEC